ncbi:tryptophan 2,3- dioxygenase [Aspergillus melleus]|uniref:Tryptophan 2,3- dioxygenase n=1 Tax=Aspergillus melleus TaxID=138277 RepID=A0ACC3B562_9EURO|nr:tryptophan 2,3- dioxygenase [Aspergillus melleus]
MSQGGLPRGVIFDDGTGSQEYRQYSGGSNAQNSLIQLFDIVLGIEHEPCADSFMEDMRQYMPGDHRRFLEDMAGTMSRGTVKMRNLIRHMVSLLMHFVNSAMFICISLRSISLLNLPRHSATWTHQMLTEEAMWHLRQKTSLVESLQEIYRAFCEELVELL